VKILTVGKKGREQLRRDHGERLIGHVDLSEVKRVGYDNAAEIARQVIERFNAGEFDVCTLFFGKLPVGDRPGADRALVLIPAEFAPPKAGDEGEGAFYEYEPGEEEILADLLPRGVATEIFAALLENAASEQGARMAAMDNATRNAGDMIDRLTLQYNRSRQAAITTELIEIIAGAEAL
jgi:F-type H+-transporting ATPase subunit gamma